MDSVCILDSCCLTFSYCNNITDKGTPECCAKLFIPMTTVYQKEGMCTTGIGLACLFGPFYTFFCWNPDEIRVSSEVEKPPKNGYSKITY